MEPDPAAGLIAALDQFNAALADVARALGNYRQLLVDAGFDRDEALELCIDVQRAVLFDGHDLDDIGL